VKECIDYVSTKNANISNVKNSLYKPSQESIVTAVSSQKALMWDQGVSKHMVEKGLSGGPYMHRPIGKHDIKYL
jgi:hypothetical protein